MTVNTSLTSFIPLAILILVPGVTAFLLARDKGRNVPLCTALGVIPFVNLGVLVYLLGATDLKMAGKLDEIAARLGARN